VEREEGGEAPPHLPLWSSMLPCRRIRARSRRNGQHNAVSSHARLLQLPELEGRKEGVGCSAAQ
jgi:hypothetical protein